MDQVTAEINFIKIILGSLGRYEDESERMVFLEKNFLNGIDDTVFRVQLEGYLRLSENELKRARDQLQEEKLKLMGTTPGNVWFLFVWIDSVTLFLGWREFFTGLFGGIASLWRSNDERSASFDELRAEIVRLKDQVEDLNYVIPPRFVTQLQRSSVLFLSDRLESIGVGIFISSTRVITAFHIIKDHYKAKSRGNYKFVPIKGKYLVDIDSKIVVTQDFRVIASDNKRDLVVLDLVSRPSHHTFCPLPAIGAMDNLPHTTRFVVTSFTTALAKQVPDMIDESFAVIPANFVKATVNFCAYHSSLFSGDSGGAVILASTGDLLCLHLETVNEANEKLRKDATPKEVVDSINSLVSGLSSGFVGLRLDSEDVQNFIYNACK